MCGPNTGYRREEAALACSDRGQQKSCYPKTQRTAPSGAGAGQKERSAAASAKELNTTICKAADRGGVQKLLDVCGQHAEVMTCVNLSTALHKLARLAKDGGSLVSPGDLRLLALHAGVLAELKRQESGAAKVLVRCLSTFAWSYATINVSGLDVDSGFEIIGRVALAHLDEFNPLELTNLLWGFAKIRHDNKELFETASSRLEADLTSFSSSNLSTLAWAYVTSQQHKAGVLHLLAEGFVDRLEQEGKALSAAKPVELVQMLWSLAKAGVTPEARVLRDIVNEVVVQLSSLKTHHEASIAAWALSQMQVRFDSFFVSAARCLSSSEVVWQMHPREMANLLWAFERQQAMGMDVHTTPYVKAALEALLPVCWQLLPQLSPQEFVSVFISLAKLPVQQGHTAQGRFLADGARQGLTLLPSFTARHRADLLGAISALTTAANSITSPEVIIALLEGLAQAAPQAMAQQTRDDVPYVRSVAQTSSHTKVTSDVFVDDHDHTFSDSAAPPPTVEQVVSGYPQRESRAPEPAKILRSSAEESYSPMFLSEPAKICISSPSSNSSARCTWGANWTSESTCASSSWGVGGSSTPPTSAAEILSASHLWLDVKEDGLLTPPGLSSPPGLPTPPGLGGPAEMDFFTNRFCMKEQFGA